MDKNLKNAALLSILLLALLLRAYPIMSNMPYGYWHDENNYIEQALRLGASNFQLQNFVHGGFFFIVLFAAYGAYFVSGLAAGLFSSRADFFLSYLRDPTAFFIIARFTAALSGMGISYLVYKITCKMFGCVRMALAAGLFSAVTFIMVQMSVFGMADMPAIFIMMLAMLALVNSIDNPGDAKAFYAAALLGGIATACKYYAAFCIVPIGAGAVIRSWGFRDRYRRTFLSLASAAFLALAGFCIGMPFFLWHIAKFYRESFVKLGGEYIAMNPHKDTWLFYLTNHLPNGLGVPLEALSLCGIAYGLYKHTKWDVVLVSFSLAYYALFMHSMGHAYHLLPAIPFLLILAARFLNSVCRKMFRGSAPAVFICVSLVAVAPTVADSAKYVRILASPDTRTQAKSWIEENVPAGAKVLAEGYVGKAAVHGPPIADDRQTLDRDLSDVMATNGTGFLIRTKIGAFGPLYGGVRSYDIFKTAELAISDIDRVRPGYIILTGDFDNVTSPELAHYEAKGHAHERDELRNYIASGYEPAAVFAPTVEFTAWFPHLADRDYALIRNVAFRSLPRYVKGPKIEIYKLKAK